MREFIYFSKRAVTHGKFTDLASAGRMDIAIHTIIHSFFISRARRENVRVHLFFNGPPDPVKHLELRSAADDGTLSPLSTKDVAKVIKKLLYKYKKGENREIMPGCYVEKKSLMPFVEELLEADRNVYVLDLRGEDLRTVEIGADPVFILGDHEGVSFKELRRLRKTVVPVTVGPQSYFASQVVAVVQNELDRRGL
jgi:tRNA (pseudouridine54-N1)-methyltransferase